MTAGGKITAVVLAGDRGGEVPFTAGDYTGRKALFPLAGRPMAMYVLDALLGVEAIGEILVVANEIGAIEAGLLGHIPDGAPVRFLEGRDQPTTSIIAAFQSEGVDTPALVLTADNPLLSAADLEAFLTLGAATRADLAVGLVEKAGFETLGLDVKRTFYRIGKGSYGGTNLFYMGSHRALSAIAEWSAMESKRKKATYIVRSFGLWGMIRASMGLMPFDEAMKRASQTLGASVDAVVLDNPWLSMDIDREDHVEPVERALRRQ